MLTEGRAFARAGVLGNPSDVYHGRALSIVIRNFQATVSLEESSQLRIEPYPGEEDVFKDVADLADSVSRQGYYGGSRLIKAAIKVFYDHCRGEGLSLPTRSFTARYRSAVPRQVGLAGSSAIITAAFRALMSFFDVEITETVQPNLILSAERDELGITAGLMDRVAQVFEGLVFMDLSRDAMEETGHGAYEPLDPDLLPNLYVAHHPGPTKVSGRVHEGLRARWERGDPEAKETIGRIAELASEGRTALLEGDHTTFSALMDENFDLRRRVMHISDWDLALVDKARRLGASAKLTGSGGAIIGTVESDVMLSEVRRELGSLGAKVLEPVVT
jgi:glucuronokinase